jgi:DNA-binding NarL/FixJ family response regulator
MAVEWRAASQNRPRVVVADDHGIVREGVRSVLEGAGFDIVGEADDGHTALRLCETLQPDVALIDVSMPMLNGIDAACEIRKVAPRTKIILLTMHDATSIVLAGLRAGVAGYVLKSAAVSTIAQAIEAVMQNQVYLSPGVSRPVVDACLSGGALLTEALSLREREVLQLVAEGKSMKDIGDLLGISARTAETHRTRIMQKLDIHHVPGLVHYAIQHGLIRVNRV